MAKVEVDEHDVGGQGVLPADLPAGVGRHDGRGGVGGGLLRNGGIGHRPAALAGFGTRGRLGGLRIGLVDSIKEDC